MTRFTGLDRAAAAAAQRGALLRAGGMLLRGLLRKPWFHRSSGPLFIGRRTRISGLRHISHTGRLVIEDGAEVHGVSTHGLHFGSGVSIGTRTAIRPSSYYGGDAGWGMTVGDRSSFATGCFVGCSGIIRIGDDVMLGPGVQLQSENHLFDDPSRTIKEQGVDRRFIVIEDGCWIGANTIVTAGVTIGTGSVIGASSVVTRDIPPFSVAAGAPARVIRRRGEARTPAEEGAQS